MDKNRSMYFLSQENFKNTHFLLNQRYIFSNSFTTDYWTGFIMKRFLLKILVPNKKI